MLSSLLAQRFRHLPVTLGSPPSLLESVEHYRALYQNVHRDAFATQGE
jgi:hypothetical protein